MLTSLGNFADGGHKGISLPKYRHPKMSWNGPTGIGSNRRISIFHNWHKILFLQAMPDRVGGVGENMTFLTDGDYVGFTSLPGKRVKLSDNGWPVACLVNHEFVSWQRTRCVYRKKNHYILTCYLDHVEKLYDIDVLAQVQLYCKLSDTI